MMKGKRGYRRSKIRVSRESLRKKGQEGGFKGDDDFKFTPPRF
jgi:hypothetical protein